MLPDVSGAVCVGACACVCAWGAAPPAEESGWDCCWPELAGACCACVWGACCAVVSGAVEVVDVDVVEVVDVLSLSAGVVPVGTVSTGVVRGTSTVT